MIASPLTLFGAARRNAAGWDLHNVVTLEQLHQACAPFANAKWRALPILAKPVSPQVCNERFNPAVPTDCVGQAADATDVDAHNAVGYAVEQQPEWSSLTALERGTCLKKVADLYEVHAAELFALLTREAGKTLADAISELREAVDFLRYYANEGLRLDGSHVEPYGAMVCISPWNFPLAILTGQIAGALAAGNVVLAKPAPQTPLVAARAVALMHEAGIPTGAVQLLPGGGEVGACLVADARIGGVCFTGSTATAQNIHRVLARNADPDAPLIAETGGLNAMVVDSTALLEQAVRDIVISAFQSAGQRCSALRMLYVQEDIAERLIEMLTGAMRELVIGAPWDIATDVGPVIDSPSRARIDAHIESCRAAGNVVAQLGVPAAGQFVAPTLIRVEGIEDLETEVFGPVLHFATFKVAELNNVITAINAKGYGLTFGLHTRVDSRVQEIVERVRAGNLYVNRNQIGAVVGSQPFGGEGLSGTGPKAGGPHYVGRMLKHSVRSESTHASATVVDSVILERAMQVVATVSMPRDQRWLVPLLMALEMQPLAQPGAIDMPGPTGESNRLYYVPRGTVLCLGPTPETALRQAVQALSAGNAVVIVCPDDDRVKAALASTKGPVAHVVGHLAAEALTNVADVAAVASAAEPPLLSAYRQALAARSGPIVPLITSLATPERYYLERHLCVDTTASGGNATLLLMSADD